MRYNQKCGDSADNSDLESTDRHFLEVLAQLNSKHLRCDLIALGAVQKTITKNMKMLLTARYVQVL